MLYEFLFIFWILDDDPYCFENVNYDTLDIANQVDVVEKIKNGDLCQIECQNEDDCNFCERVNGCIGGGCTEMGCDDGNVLKLLIL